MPLKGAKRTERKGPLIKNQHCTPPSRIKSLDASIVDSVELPCTTPQSLEKLNSILSGTTNKHAVLSDELDTLQIELESILLTSLKRSKSLASVFSLGCRENGAHVSPKDKLSLSAVSSSKQRMLSAPVRNFASSIKVLQTPKLHVDIESTPSRSKRGSFSSGTKAAGTKPVRFRIYNLPNEFPDRFWKFVDDYCSGCSEEDIEYVEKLLSQCSETALNDYLKVPGGSRANCKAELEAAKSQHGKEKVVKHRRPSETQLSPALKRIKREPSSSNQAQCSSSDAAADQVDLGPFAQRLIQSFIDEKPSVPVIDERSLEEATEGKDFPHLNGVNSSTAALLKALNLGNSIALEKKVKRELQDQGILEPEMPSDDEDCATPGHAAAFAFANDDEVTSELKRAQAQLKTVAEQNRRRIQKLLEFVKRDVKRQTLKQQLKDINDQIIEISNRHFSMIPRKKPNKKEADAIEKLLKQRKTLSKELESQWADYLRCY